MEETQSPGNERAVGGYVLEMIQPACHPGSDTWSAKAWLEDDISELLPYLNAELKGADYDHDSKVLIWHDGTRKHAFRPHEIALAPVQNREEAAGLIDDLLKRANEIWGRRHEIEPDFDRRELPSVLAIYKLLPRTNCKDCGQLTCMAFATQARKGHAELAQCPHLSADARDRILALFRSS